MKAAITVILIVGVIVGFVLFAFNLGNAPSSAPVDLLAKATFDEKADKFKSLLSITGTDTDTTYDMGDYGVLNTVLTKEQFANCIKTFHADDKVELPTHEEAAIIDTLPFDAHTPGVEGFRPGVIAYRSAGLRSKDMPFDFLLVAHNEKTGQTSFLLGVKKPDLLLSSKEPQKPVAPPMSKDELEKKAKSGNIEAQFELAELLIKEGGPKSKEEAQNWYERAAERGNAEAQYRLGRGYLDDTFGKPDLSTAKKWLQKSAAQNFTPAKVSLKRLVGSRIHKEERLETLQTLAKADDEDAQFELGQYYEVVKHDYKEACKWYEKSASHGYIDATNAKARLYEKMGEKAKSIASYAVAADAGSYEAMMLCGDYYQKQGRLDEACRFYKKAVLRDRSALGRSLTAITPESECKPIDDLVKAGNLKSAAEKYKQAAIRRHQMR